MAEPSKKTVFTDEERALGVDEDGGQLTPEQRLDPVDPKAKAPAPEQNQGE